MSMDVLRIEQQGNVKVITLNRPKSLNALNKEVIQALEDTFRSIEGDASIQGVILTGEGERAFAAGADITEFQNLEAKDGEAFAVKGQEVFSLIEHCTKPVIAVVNGFALGGGCELAMACHMRIATSNAKFGQPEVNLGLIPGYGGSQRLLHLIGKGKGLEYLMTAEIIPASTALLLGLVNYVEEDKAAAMEKAQSLLATIATKAPLAIGHVIQCANAVYDESLNGYYEEAKRFGACMATEDFKEGASAFLEKRKASFKGQ